MSLDQRLRRHLMDSASAIPVSTTEPLAQVQARGRRRIRVRRTGQLVLAVATLAIVAAGVWSVPWSRLKAADPATLGPTPVGSYFVEVDDSPEARSQEMVGGWLVVLRGDGGITYYSPPRFTLTDGPTYRVVGDQMGTDLFSSRSGCQLDDRGTLAEYRWVLQGNQLRFSTLTDTCAARLLLLTGQAWQRMS